MDWPLISLSATAWNGDDFFCGFSYFFCISFDWMKIMGEDRNFHQIKDQLIAVKVTFEGISFVFVRSFRCRVLEISLTFTASMGKESTYQFCFLLCPKITEEFGEKCHDYSGSMMVVGGCVLVCIDLQKIYRLQ